MRNISPHLTYDKATYTGTGLSNEPNEQQLKNITDWAFAIYEPICIFFGEHIQTNSIFRGKIVNKKIGGVETSQHCANKGAAGDLDSKNDLSNAKIFHYIKDKLVFDQLIWEFGTKEFPKWVHVSYNKNNNRKQVLVSVKELDSKGKMVTKYKPFVS